MLKKDQSFVYALFYDQGSAAAAVQQLIDAGFDTEHIGGLMLNDSGVADLPLEHKTRMVSGGIIGTALGASLAAIALPALGLLAFGGAFAAGGLAGSVAGTLGGLGLWRDEIDFPRQAFVHGAVLVGTLTSKERASQARGALLAAGADKTLHATQAAAERDLLEQARHTGPAE